MSSSPDQGCGPTPKPAPWIPTVCVDIDAMVQHYRKQLPILIKPDDCLTCNGKGIMVCNDKVIGTDVKVIGRLKDEGAYVSSEGMGRINCDIKSILESAKQAGFTLALVHPPAGWVAPAARDSA